MRNTAALRRFAVVLTVCAAAFGLAAGSAHAAVDQFKGIWMNADASTRGLVRIQITQGVHSLYVRPFGACSPTPCDWGNAPLTTYGDNVSDTSHSYATAEYNQGFAVRAMTFQLVDPYTLVVHTYSRFTDGSGRQNYHTRELFHKLVIKPFPLPLAPIGP
jgi:hypothetical protein